MRQTSALSRSTTMAIACTERSHSRSTVTPAITRLSGRSAWTTCTYRASTSWLSSTQIATTISVTTLWRIDATRYGAIISRFRRWLSCTTSPWRSMSTKTNPLVSSMQLRRTRVAVSPTLPYAYPSTVVTITTRSCQRTGTARSTPTSRPRLAALKIRESRKHWLPWTRMMYPLTLSSTRSCEAASRWLLRRILKERSQHLGRASSAQCLLLSQARLLALKHKPRHGPSLSVFRSRTCKHSSSMPPYTCLYSNRHRSTLPSS